MTGSPPQRGTRSTVGNRGCSDGTVLTEAERCVALWPRRPWKVRMMTSNQSQSSADSTPRIVTINTEPRLDGDRVAPHDAGADTGRPSRSGTSWYGSGSEVEEGYENQGRQRVQAGGDVTEEEAGYQERRERCRLSAAKEGMSRQVVPEVGSLNGEQAPVPVRAMSSMSLDGLGLGPNRRLATQCLSDGHMYTVEAARHLPSRWSVEVCPASRENDYRTVVDEMRRSRIYDREEIAASNAVPNEGGPTFLPRGDEGTSPQARLPESLIETCELERCIERGWIQDTRPLFRRTRDNGEDWRFPGVVGRAATLQPPKMERSPTGQEPQPPPVTRRWGYGWCGPSSPILAPVCPRETEWKIGGRGRQDVSKCGDEWTSLLREGEVYSQRLPTEVKSIEPAEGFLFRSGLRAAPVGRMMASQAMAWRLDDGTEEYAGNRKTFLHPGRSTTALRGGVLRAGCAATSGLSRSGATTEVP